MIPALKAGKVDLVAAGMSYSDEHAKQVDFTVAYLEGSPLCMVYSKKRFAKVDVEDLSTLQVVVCDGYTADIYATDTLGLKPVKLSNPIDAMMALKSGRADVFIAAQNTLQPLLKGQDEYIYSVIEGVADNCAMLLPKGSLLLKPVDAALLETKKEGTLAKLQKKWGLQ